HPADPAAHIGVERQVDAAQQHLALAGLRQWSFGDLEIFRHRQAARPPLQQDLTIALGHRGTSSQAFADDATTRRTAGVSPAQCRTAAVPILVPRDGPGRAAYDHSVASGCEESTMTAVLTNAARERLD